MKRNFARETKEPKYIVERKKSKIGVIGLGSGAGASFVAMALAQELAETGRSVGFLELSQGRVGRALTYNVIDMAQRFQRRTFHKLYGEAENNRGSRHKTNIEAGINWILISPEENLREISLSPSQEARLIDGLAGDYIVCDLGSDFNRERLCQMDVLVCVIDPLPSKLIGRREVYQKLIQSDYKKVWVLNKDNMGVHRKSFLGYIKVKTSVKIPLISGETIYKAEYQCRLPYEQREIRDQIEAPMKKLVMEIDEVK